MKGILTGSIAFFTIVSYSVFELGNKKSIKSGTTCRQRSLSNDNSKIEAETWYLALQIYLTEFYFPHRRSFYLEFVCKGFKIFVVCFSSILI